MSGNAPWEAAKYQSRFTLERFYDRQRANPIEEGSVRLIPALAAGNYTFVRRKKREPRANFRKLRVLR